MTTLAITRGLPASGKTTLARAWVAEDEANRARVNRDDLREAMFGRPAPLPWELEEAVTMAQRAAVTALLRGGRSVIVDDMHLRLRYVTAWSSVAESTGATLEVIDVPTDADECVRRNAARAERGERAVDEQVIRDLAQRFRKLEPYVAPEKPAAALYTPDPSLPPAWVVDIDGTLALMGDRSPYDHDRVDEDGICEQVRAIVHALADRGYLIVIASGRSEEGRAKTEGWLAQHGIDYDLLVMRPAGDSRKDAIIKRELFDAHIAPSYNIVGVLDDRNQVVEMWRGLGLFCAQVAPGDF